MCCNGYRLSPTSATTSRACGRKARITVWSPYSWAPRIECGSWWVPDANRCRSDGSGARCLLTALGLVIAALHSLAAQQRFACLGGNQRHVHDVRHRPGWVDADVVRLAPLIFLSGDLVAHPESVVVLHTQGAHVQPQRGLLGGE